MRRRFAITALLVLLASAATVPATAAAPPDPFYGTLFDDNLNLTRAQRDLDMDHQAAMGSGPSACTSSGR